MESEFAKKLDDLIRQELLLLGYDYRSVVSGIEEAPSSDGVTVRMQPPWEDIVFEEPDESLAEDAFAARVGRRLKVVLEAPERPAGPEPDVPDLE